MPLHSRRIVTGHDETGKSIILSDGPPPHILNRGTDVDFLEMWNVETVPASITATEPEPTSETSRTPPAPNGVKVRYNDFYPGHIKKLPARADGRHPMMHRTKSLDFGIVLSGEIYMILDDSEVHLKSGDLVIQRGTDHAWENRADKVCRMAFILVGAGFSPDLLSLLPANVEIRE